MTQYQSNMPGDLPPGIPPYAGGPYGQPPARTSAAAVTSMVLGILLCIPIITGLGAVVFGIVGIRSTSKPGVTGRGMAIAGIILGLLSIVGWTGFGGLMGVLYTQTAPDRAIAKSFVADLSAGNTAAAQTLCAPAVTSDQLDAAVAQVALYGAIKSVTMMGFSINSNNGATSAVVSGSVIYATGPKTITLTLTHPRGGTPLIQSFRIQ